LNEQANEKEKTNHFECAPTISNVVERLNLREQSANPSISDGCSAPEIDFLALHFRELSDSLLNSLSFAHLQATTPEIDFLASHFHHVTIL
jgi:hypothetical protein